VIEAIGSGTSADHADGESGADRPGAAADGVTETLVPRQAAAGDDAGGRPVGPVGGLLTAVAGVGPEPDTGGDGEFRVALLGELERRYLRALRRHACAAAVPRVWQVVLDQWEAGTDPCRSLLAGTYALVGHDLAPAVVSACTLLGRSPGRAERAVVEALLDLVARLLADTVDSAGADPATRGDAAGLTLLLGRGEGWRQAEHLWTVRGRPSEAAKERAALDWRAALVARALLGAR
jgi:hypothetical protein